MSANNPDITPADIITEVEAHLGTPNISSTVYLPWISYAYQKTWQALVGAGQGVKERLFGAYLAYTLTNGTAEYTLNTVMPRFGGVLKLEILYGGTSDQRATLRLLPSLSQWQNQGNVSTSYRAKNTPLYYIIGNTIGFIPTPPSTDASNAILYAWYIKRPYQLTGTDDVIDLPYRFLTPIKDYVLAKAIQLENEDYATSRQLESDFRQQLEEIVVAAVSEGDENEGDGVEVSDSGSLYENPFG